MNLLLISPLFSKILQLIASLSIIVIIHELGHFLPAKWFGCRVEKFYLFFNPWWSIYKKKVKDTEYGIGWLPLGGYVKIAGMIDESLDKEHLNKAPENWEFRSKKAWQKIIVMAGGVFMNLVLGVLIFIGIAYFCGEEYIPNKNLKYGLYVHPTLNQIGMQNGDIVVQVGNKKIDNYNEVFSTLIYNESKNITILRNGSEINLTIPANFISTLQKLISKREPILTPRFPCIVDSVNLRNQFKMGVLMKGDKIVSFRNKNVAFFDELKMMKQYFKDSIIELGVERDGQLEKIIVQLDKEAGIGFNPKYFGDILEPVVKHYSLLESIPAGIKKTYNTLSGYIKGLKLLATSKEIKVKENLGGLISIGNMFPSDFSWKSFWLLTAIISISIGVMNLLPIPALDGGHIIFALYEWISGKQPSLKFQEYAQTIGMILLLGLMFYALGLDLLRVFR